MTRTPVAAVAAARQQSEHGPPFAPNLCKRQTRLAFSVPSDGSTNAATAWTRTDHRLPDSAPWTPGALVWWTGGTGGHGHVAFCAYRTGYVWSVDIKRPGYWDRVPLEQITRTWPRLKFAGRSRDIDGVIVAPVRLPATPVIDAALASAVKARDARTGGKVREQLALAVTALQRARALARGTAK